VRFCLLFLLLLSGVRARADVMLFIEDPINFLGHVSSTGHAALLVDGLCSDDHVSMRVCRPGEGGSIISRYKGIDGHDWVAMPPGAYLFAVDSAEEIPETVSVAEVEQLRVEYRESHADGFAREPSEYGWEQLLGASYRRGMICIRVHTNAEQEARLMNWLNRHNDRSHFNFFFSNCADFARQMLNVLFPGAIHRNLFYDLGMTTPKQVASSLNHYAKRHPELGFEAYELPQVPGGVPRSGDLRGVTESFAKSKPYLLPLAILNPIGVGSLGALGIVDHRYEGKTAVQIDEEFFFRADGSVTVAGGAEE